MRTANGPIGRPSAAGLRWARAVLQARSLEGFDGVFADPSARVRMGVGAAGASAPEEPQVDQGRDHDLEQRSQGQYSSPEGQPKTGK